MSTAREEGVIGNWLKLALPITTHMIHVLTRCHFVYIQSYKHNNNANTNHIRGRCLPWQLSQSATSELRRKLYTRFDTSHLLCSLDVDQSTRRWCAQALEKNLDRRCDRNSRAYAIVLCSENVLGVIGLITDGIR